jgi:beta-N-acetylhexosaminidase
LDRHTVATPVPRGRGAATALGALGALTALVAVLAWTALAGPASAASSAGRPLRARAASLSVPELAGERIVYAYSGLRPPTALLSAIRAGEAAGVILFGPNISSLAQIRSVAAQLQRANAASPVHARLLLLVDQ